MANMSGLNIGLSALYAQRRGLEVTGQNIANANTEGYTRQKANLEAMGGQVVPAMWSRSTGVGNGVTVASVERMRDVFLESRGMTEHGNQAQMESRATALGRIESTLGEPSEHGLQAQLAEFWGGWGDVANRPSDLAARAQIIERGSQLANTLNGQADRLGQEWNGAYVAMDAVAGEINSAAARIAELNATIKAAGADGMPANELADQRDALIQRLADLAGVTARAGEHGQMDVYIGGVALVRGQTAERVTVAGAAELTSPAGQVELAWESDGTAATVTGGVAAGTLATLNDIIPRYMGELDAVAKALHDEVNAVHEAGFDATGTAGKPFFVFAPPATGPTALSLRLNDLKPGEVAAASEPGGSRDGAQAAEMAKISHSKTGPDALYRSTVVSLGVESQTAQRRLAMQSEITRQVDAARESHSGVNLDEEMTNMLAYQRAYEGAARFVTTIDQMLDTLINRTGLVGR